LFVNRKSKFTKEAVPKFRSGFFYYHAVVAKSKKQFVSYSFKKTLLMFYKVKSGDTLSKIAKKFSIPVDLLLSFNKTIVNPSKIFIGQQVFIPNVEDVPVNNITVETTTATDLITRARSAINKGIRYKLGAGGMNPKTVLPTTNKLCDCSGFVCWILGISRKTDIPFYKQFGGWIFTDSMVADVNSQTGIFERINIPEPGCITVFGAGNKIGHVGLVSKVSNGKMDKVIHCSSGNDKKFHDSIQETGSEIFERADNVWGKFIG
jgi:LysM repeat protein